ncbi:hypothetical protein DL96DRAFT_501140 [Flagelloscypha sp. PMI_526]|nr:hypothetical protein DL96DRAFT_501140 [Flagelloscypha sp. PMI_526]
MSTQPSGKPPGFFKSILFLIPVFVAGPYLAISNHRALPTPLSALVDPRTKAPQISEERILNLTRYLSEDIGYRTIGSSEHAAADEWMGRQTAEIKEQCDRIVRSTGRALECEVWRQKGSASHRFDIAGKRVYKTYVDIPNHVLRISNGTAEGKANAVLVNAHLDSTLPSPGAADDALSVAIMLDIVRVLLNTNKWSPKHSLIFLWNGAEESLQDGSHLYATQHETRSTVRAVINLEAAGTRNRELLFQATSEEMIEAYSHVPRPFGTIFANEVFSSGILLSDTDFRQFEQYLDVTGLDMAVVGHSYFYHTRKDLVENIQPGVAQNMAENTLALLSYLSSSSSPLPNLSRNLTAVQEGEIHGAAARLRPKTVFFSYLGLFWTYSFTAAKFIYLLLALTSYGIVKTRFQPLPLRRAPTAKNAPPPEPFNLTNGIVAVIGGLVGAVIGPLLVAGGMFYMGKEMSWFKDTLTGPLILYAPPAGFGALLIQTVLPQVTERELLSAVLVLQSAFACVLQALDIGSAALLVLNAAPLFIVIFAFSHLAPPGKPVPITLAMYAAAGAVPLYNGALVLIPTLEVFVPLTGRIGGSLPSDFLIAAIVSLLSSLGVPLFLPFARRFSRPVALLLLASLTAAGIGSSFVRDTFSPDHPRRMFVLALEDTDTNKYTLHFGNQDTAPGMDEMMRDMADSFSQNAVLTKPKNFEEMEVGWDLVYPFSTVLKPYDMVIPNSFIEASPAYHSLWKLKFSIKATKDITLENGTRVLDLQIDHPGLIWPVLSFEAHVSSWSLDAHPPPSYERHWVREAAFHRVSTYTLSLSIEPHNNSTDLNIRWVGLQEGGTWPAKAQEYIAQKGRTKDAAVSMRVFEELDGWITGWSGDTVDATLLGAVKGTVNI